MTRRRKRNEPWGRLNLLVNLSRLVVEFVRWLWHTQP
ncbi:hypothetical protein J2T11_002329 [Paenarthrobacter nicotinovorans]|nr:hypothetical protein [Paenarthrobacter nicotinovorans]